MTSPALILLLLTTLLALTLRRVSGLRPLATYERLRLTPLQRAAAALALVSFLWPTYIYFALPVGPAVNPYTLLALVTCAVAAPRIGALALAFLYGRRGGALRDPLVRIALLMLAWRMAASALFFAETGTRGLVEVVTVAVPLLLITMCTPALQFKRVLTLLSGAAVAVVCFAFSDLLTQTVTLQPLASALIPSESQSESATIAAQLISDKNRGAGLRLQSLMTHPIVLGEFCAMMTVLLAAALWAGNTGVVRRLFYLGLLVANGVVITYTDSRSAILIAPAVSILLLLLLKARTFSTPRLALLIFLTIGTTIGALLFGGIIELAVLGRTNDETTSSLGRVAMLSIAWEKMLASPIVGYGPGSAASIVGIQGQGGVFTLDNLFFRLALDWGLPLGITHYLLLVLLLKRCFASAMSKSVDSEHVFSAAGACVVVAYLLTSLILAIDDLFLFTVWIGLACCPQITSNRTRGHPAHNGLLATTRG